MTCFRSREPRAMSAAMMAVMVPMTMTTVRAGVPSTASKSGKVRATR